MLDKWIESVFLKRAALATAAAVVAQWLGHEASILHRLSAWGVTATLHIDQNILAQHLTVVFFALSQGLHEWIAAKYPAIGKWL